LRGGWGRGTERGLATVRQQLTPLAHRIKGDSVAIPLICFRPVVRQLCALHLAVFERAREKPMQPCRTGQFPVAEQAPEISFPIAGASVEINISNFQNSSFSFIIEECFHEVESKVAVGPRVH